ncbi:hypothetical protein, partial [Brevundimonas sp.]
RRTLILSMAVLALGTRPAMAAPEATAPEPASVTMTGVGLPVFVDGRVRNHIFVELKLHLKAGFAVEQARAKDTVMRDALIREGHRRSFGMADNWNRVDERALAAAVMQITATHLGRGNVVRVEIVRQTPRMRVRTPSAVPAS